MAMTIVEAARPITGGVDTHRDVHVAAALDANGGVVGVESFATTPKGPRALVAWLGSFGVVAKVGVEGTGTYGVGLVRHLRKAGIEVLEVNRPNREERRRNGKSDPVEAARAVLSGRARASAKSRDGNVEAIRALLVARRSAREARTGAINQIRQLSFTAPETLRARLAPPVECHGGGRSSPPAAPARSPGGVRHEGGPLHPRPTGHGSRGGGRPARGAAFRARARRRP